MRKTIYAKAIAYYLTEVNPEKFTAAGNGLCIVISKFVGKEIKSYNELIKDFPELKANKEFLGWRDEKGFFARIKILENGIKKVRN